MKTYIFERNRMKAECILGKLEKERKLLKKKFRKLKLITEKGKIISYKEQKAVAFL